MAEKKTYILEIESFDGEDRSIFVSDADGSDAGSLYCVVSVSDNGASIVDNGYRTLAEARELWPEAIPPNPGQCMTPAAAERNAIQANTPTPQQDTATPKTKLTLSMPAEAAQRLKGLFEAGGPEAEELKRQGVLSVDVKAQECAVCDKPATETVAGTPYCATHGADFRGYLADQITG